ncbi:MAG: DUF3667 domain-containing protein [Taibaiella sp.]|nr:DUF3667 domain-containing protein [Taibaiella sp.]
MESKIIHRELRKDNACLNCGNKVEHRYCSYCGQENIHPNESAVHLLMHLHNHTEHYQFSLFSTLKKLLFSPGFLTKEYISGKRKKYTHPIRIYLVVSFIYFFLILGILDKPAIARYSPSNPASQIIYIPAKAFGLWDFEIGLPKYNSVHEYDSIQNTLSNADRDEGLLRYYKRRSAKIYEDYNPQKATEIFTEKVGQTIPKAIFILIPILSFWIWLFYNKKKYVYSNHLIFSLHFNSFIFIVIIITTLINLPLQYIHGTAIQIYIWIASLMVILGYFIAALYYTYKEALWVNIIKGTIIMIVYLIFTLITGIAFFVYPFLTI